MKQVDFWRFSEQSACKKIAIDRQTKIHENIENREAKTHKNGKNFDVMSCVDVIIECLLHSNQSFFNILFKQTQQNFITHICAYPNFLKSVSMNPQNKIHDSANNLILDHLWLLTKQFQQVSKLSS